MESADERRSLLAGRGGKVASLVALVVIGGLAILLVLPLFHDRGSDHARGTCKSNLRQIVLACHMYADDHEGRFPDRFEELCFEYVENPKAFSCAAVLSSYEDFKTGKVTDKSSSYVLVPGLNSDMPPEIILAYERSGRNHKARGRNVAFVDAHVEWMRDAEFQKRLEEQHKKSAESEWAAGEQ